MRMKNKKPSIMHVIDSLSLGGAERMLVDIVNKIDRQKFSLSVCVTRSGTDLKEDLVADVPTKVLGRKSSLDISSLLALQEFSKKQGVDIYHAHGRSTFSFLLAAKFLGFHTKPIVLHDHFGNIEFDKSIPLWFRIFGARNIAHYIGVCDKLADWAKSAGVPSEKITVIENALDFTRFDRYQAIDLHSHFSIPAEKKIGVFVGNIRYAKGLDNLIKISDQIPEDVMPYFIILGKEIEIEYVEKCREVINNFGKNDFFIFAGQQKNIVSWIKGSDFAVIPSRSESGPLVLIEFMACGLPFVSFEVGGISRKVSSYFPENFIHPGDNEKFFERMSQLINTPLENLEYQSNKIKKIAHDLFDIDEQLPSICQVYSSILDETL